MEQVIPTSSCKLKSNLSKLNAKKNTLNPIWDETFHFKIERGNEVLQVTVMDKNRDEDKDDFEGQCSIGVDQLRDQLKVEKVIPLQPENPYEKWQGKIKFELRWIYSVVKLLKDLIQDHELEYKWSLDMKREFEDKIYQLKKLFWWIYKSQLKELEHRDIENNEYEGNTVAQLAGTVSI